MIDRIRRLFSLPPEPFPALEPALPACRESFKVGMSRLALAIATLLLLVNLACDPGATVTYVNRFDENITVFIDGQTEATIGAGEAKRFSTLEFGGRALIEGRTKDGTVVYSARLTWDEFKQQNWTIVIAPSPSPSPVPQ